MDSSWFTPTVLFCFLNLIIISILIHAFYSNKSHKKQLAQHDSPLELNRSSSLLARVKSINFSMKHFDPFQPQTNYEIHETQEVAPVPATTEKILSGCEEVPVKTQEKKEQLAQQDSPHELNRSSSLLARLKSINFSMKHFDPFQPQTNYEIHETQQVAPVPATTEKISSVSEEVPVKTQEKKEQPTTTTTTTVQERKKNKLRARRGEAAVVKTVSFKGDEQVDAKADDFINRFKQQLKLQRIESIKRYTQMLTGGASSTN